MKSNQIKTSHNYNFRKFTPSRPDCRKVKDNLKPVGEIQTMTELKSNFTKKEARRPKSAREEFKKNRDSLKASGQVCVVCLSEVLSLYNVRLTTSESIQTM